MSERQSNLFDVETVTESPSKRCKTCGCEKPLSDFHRSGKSAKFRFGECKECHYKRQREWARHNPERMREYRRKSNEKRKAAIAVKKSQQPPVVVPQTKPCSRCGVSKPLSEFNRHPTGKWKRQASCKACQRIGWKEFARRNPDAQKESRKRFLKTDKWKSIRLRHRYGITLEQQRAAFAAQDGKCAICRCPLELGTKNCHTEHDHKTRRFRGIACRACNHIIGEAEKSGDPIAVLTAAIAYLKRHSDPAGDEGACL
jgi:Recombination endonuclease VII